MRRRALGQRSDQVAGKASDTSDKLNELTEERVQVLENELAEFTRLAPMTLLASTLAHELGQPLAAVANYVSGAHRLIKEGSAPKMHLVEEALSAAAAANQRSSDIVRSMRSIISGGSANRQPENLVSLVERVSLLAMAQTDDFGVDYRIDIDRGVETVFVDRVQLEQILINLLRNAIDAVAAQPVRRITLAARQVGPDVHISVSDSGPGVAPEIEGKLFRAMRSTKTDGLGVGLSICRTMAEANGGAIRYAPAPGGGACFTVTLPAQEMPGQVRG